MSRGRTAEVESTDFVNPELNGLIDFGALPVGGVTVMPVTEREFKNDQEGKLAYEKFMAEPIVIRIHRTADKNEPPIAELGLNGVKAFVPRDKPVRLPRAYVEILARSQVRNYSQERNPDPNADEGMFTKRHGGASYPFQVIKDDNPRGRAWLARITHESI